MMSPVGRHPLLGKEGASQWQMTWVAKNSSQIKKQKQWIEATDCHHYRIRSPVAPCKSCPDRSNLQPKAGGKPATQLS